MTKGQEFADELTILVKKYGLILEIGYEHQIHLESFDRYLIGPKPEGHYVYEFGQLEWK